MNDRQLGMARVMRLHGYTYRQIGQLFGVSDTAARYMIQGRPGRPNRVLCADGTDPWFEAARQGLPWDQARIYVDNLNHRRN